MLYRTETVTFLEGVPGFVQGLVRGLLRRDLDEGPVNVVGAVLERIYRYALVVAVHPPQILIRDRVGIDSIDRDAAAPPCHRVGPGLEQILRHRDSRPD